MELQRRYADILQQGLGLVAISYDPPETLKRFADSRGITFPLISDPGSSIIRVYGILNEGEKPGSRGHGIPHPGTFIVDRQGTVVSRYFEAAYQERYTVATMLPALGAAASMTATTAHLSLTASLSDAAASPGQRLWMAVEITPGPGMHVYAPGKHSYQVVRLVIDPQPWLRVHDAGYPPPEIYHFKPLDERVEVYTQPFRLRRDVTLLATQEAQKQLTAAGSITLTGALEYQACDDRICYNPARVPIALTVRVTPLDRRPPG